MTEDEYVYATDMWRLNTARQLLGDLNYRTKQSVDYQRWHEVMAWLVKSSEKLAESIPPLMEIK